MRPLMERLMSRVVFDNNGCWVFTGARYVGYGVIGVGPRGTGTILTHRATFEAYKGPIPDGLEIDHLCRNRACCNPGHLRAVDRSANNLNGARSLYPNTHCKNGHAFTPENTYQSKRQRHCRACQKAKYQRARADPDRYAALLAASAAGKRERRRLQRKSAA